MVRVRSVFGLRFRFNIHHSFSEIRLYQLKFMNGYTPRERKNQYELERRVHERNFENSKLMRQILVVYFW